MTGRPLFGRTGKALAAVVTIVDEEFDAVKRVGGFRTLAHDTSFLTRNETASAHHDVLLAKSPDRGNAACMGLVQDLVERYRPEFIVLSGIAGGMEGRDDIALGDVVVADLVENFEMRKLVDGKNLTRRVASDHPSIFLRETIAQRVRLRDGWRARDLPPRPGGGAPKVVVGNLIAGDKVLGDGDNAYQKLILDEYDRAIAVDMESAGLARGVYQARATRHYNLHYLVVRGISDLVAAENNNAMRREWRDYAAATSAAFALDVVDEIVALCPRDVI